mmetsp:Transcript_30862/g.57729  ORF Transcript_30862/g.57729 Transcript_30862/m.57729 type:complete len:731 (-) Transcript_30862:79-2271(-)
MALEPLRKQLEEQSRTLGPRSPETLATMHILAESLSKQRCWAEAEELLRKVVEARRDVLGNEHGETLSSQALLSQVLGAQARGQEELALESAPGAVQADRQRSAASDDPDDLDSLVDGSCDIEANGDADSRSCAAAAQAVPMTTPTNDKKKNNKRPASPGGERQHRKTRKQPPGAPPHPPQTPGSPVPSTDAAASGGAANGHVNDGPADAGLALKMTADAAEERAKRAEEQNVQLRQAYRLQGDAMRQCRQTIARLLVQDAKKELAEEKDRMHAAAHHLGRWRQSTPGLGQKGTWEGGYEAEAIAKIKERISMDQKNIAAERRRRWTSLRSKKKASSAGGEEEAADDDEDEIREICTHRAAALARESEAVDKRERNLTTQRTLHLKRQQRIEAADRSSFHGFPLLAEKYQLLNMIGRGGFSEVYRAFNLDANCLCAVKIHELGKEMTDQQRQVYIRRAMREVDIQKQLQHPRVVTMQDCFPISTKAFGTVLQLCEGETLDEYIKMHGPLPEKEARGILIQILSGLKYMNTNGRKIIHYDLKPGNLFFHCGEVKIADFGLSKVVNESFGESIDLTSQGAGTYWYLPPECFAEAGQEPPKISNKVDVWSTGVIFYEILFNRRPFGHGQSQEALRRAAMAGQAFSVEIPTTPKVGIEGSKFLKRLLTVNREDRPDVIDAYNDPYIRATRSKNGAASSSSSAAASGSAGASATAACSLPTSGSTSSFASAGSGG